MCDQPYPVLLSVVRQRTDRGPDGIPAKTSPDQEIRGLALERQVELPGRAMATADEIAGARRPVVVTRFGKRNECLLHGGTGEPVSSQFGPNPQWAVAGRDPCPRQTTGETVVVLPPSFRHSLDRGHGLILGNPASHQLAGQFLPGMLASNQEPERALRGCRFVSTGFPSGRRVRGRPVGRAPICRSRLCPGMPHAASITPRLLPPVPAPRPWGRTSRAAPFPVAWQQQGFP